MANMIVVRVPRALRVLLVFPLALSLAFLAKERDVGLAMSAALFAFLAVLGGNRWVVDETGIERRFPLMKRVRLDWRDIGTIELVPPAGNLRFRREPLRPLEVSVRMAGANDLIRMTLERAPSWAMTDAVRASLKARLDAAVVVPPTTLIPLDISSREDAAARWRDNPFFVLGLSPECSRADVERVGQKLLALLAIDSAPAKTFTTHLGKVHLLTRTPESVRTAMAELRDPERRLLHEMWAHVGSDPSPSPSGRADPSRPWPEAMAAIHWRCP